MSAAPMERQAPAARMTGLRANSFAAIVILLTEYGLGVWVSLYGHLPASDHGASIAMGRCGRCRHRRLRARPSAFRRCRRVGATVAASQPEGNHVPRATRIRPGG